MENQTVILFQNKSIRRLWHEGTWWFSVVDVIQILTESTNPSNYWTMLKKRENQLSTICGKLKFAADDGKMRPTDCADTDGLLRIIMSIPSPNVEPFKKWLAQVGRERLEEIADPELGYDRIRDLYKAKGYPDEWIERRMQTIETRRQLTDEWQARGVNENKEYAILTAEIARATFGVAPAQHKNLKGLTKPSQYLRDHMTPIELIFTALSEETTRMVTVRDDAQGFAENHDAASEGGKIAGKARRNFEVNSGFTVVSPTNYLLQNAVEERNFDEIGKPFVEEFPYPTPPTA